jgi:hypothetical protein
MHLLRQQAGGLLKKLNIFELCSYAGYAAMEVFKESEPA